MTDIPQELPDDPEKDSIDSSAQKELTEKALSNRESLFRTLVNTIPDLIWLKDADGVYLSCNHMFERVFGAGEADIIGKTDYDFLDEELADFFRQNDRKAMAAGGPTSNEEQVTFADDGSRAFLETIKTPMFDTDGKLIGILGIGRDITERKIAEEALRESEERFKALHNASFGGIAIHDQGVILECNQGLSEISGFGYDELIGMDGLLLIAEQSREAVMKNIRSGYEKPYEALGVRKNGEEYPLRLEARIIPYKGKMVRVVEFRDISDRKALEDQLLQAQKMESIGQLAGGVAHDFNNMLGVILGYTEMAMEQVAAGQPMYKDLHEIQQAAQRSADLTRQLLIFARKQTIKPRKIDLNETVEGMLKMLRRLIGEDIDLIWLPGRDLWPVKVDPSQIDQILANLCVNARDAIEGVGKVTIETGLASFDEEWCTAHPGVVPGEYVLLAVSDNGCGMDRETINHLFEPFFTTKEQGKGTGLGLASVYGAVTQNKGCINVYSESGQGTTFKVYLPRYVIRTESLPTQVPVEAAPRGHETILLVEDEPAILEMTTIMLERQGYTVVGAGTPGEAIRLAEEHTAQIDLLITDVVMPEMNGLDLAGKITSLHPDIKLLFMSGYTASIIAQQGVLDDGVTLIQKPFSKADMVEKLREALEG